jgi:hypothetical protein
MKDLSLPEKQAIIQFLIWQSHRDGELTAQEQEFLKNIADQMGLKDLPKSDELKKLDDPYPVLKHLKTKESQLLLLKLLIQVSFADEVYDAREREALVVTAKILGWPLNTVDAIEHELTENLKAKLTDLNSENQEFSTAVTQKSQEWDWWKIGQIAGAAVVGGAALVVTAGVAAPVLGGLIGTQLLGLSGAAATSAGLALLGGGSLAAGGAGVAGGIAVLTTALGACGAGVAAWKASHILGDIEEWDIQYVDGSGLHVCLGISGFLQQGQGSLEAWTSLRNVFPQAVNYSLMWESKAQHHVYESVMSVGQKSFAGFAAAAAAKSATKMAFQALVWPTAILSAMDIIDNPWAVARNRADQAGKLLGDYLAENQFGGLPVTLIGYSLGTQVILSALNRLAELGSHGKIYNVYLLAGAVAQNDQRLQVLDQVVAGTVVNVYCRSDLVLRYIYRLAEGFAQPIGVELLDHDGVVNLDVSDFVNGHLDYVPNLQRILTEVKLSIGYQEIFESSLSQANETVENLDQLILKDLISILKQVPGMTNASFSDFAHATPVVRFKNNLHIRTWKNIFGVDHIFIGRDSNCLYGGFVGWVHSEGMESALKKIKIKYSEFIV